MDKYAYISNSNPAVIEELYSKYKENPENVDEKWRAFFDGFDFFMDVKNSDPLQTETSSPKALKEIAVSKLIDAYRTRGHLIADTNPVRERRHHKADLQLNYFNLSEQDMNQEFEAGREIGLKNATLSSIINHLQKTYCSSIGVEFMHCQNEKLREWMVANMEPITNHPNYSKEKQLQILELINKSVNFENFLQTKFVGKKRFSLEGIEALIPSLDSAINVGADLGVKECVLGMAHRGRLNVLVNVFQKTYENVFSEFEESNVYDDQWSGDVKYHLGRSADIKTKNGHDVHLSLVPNPSHLETVNPVVTGICYSKAKTLYDGNSESVLPIMIHGDAAIAGQGVNYELSNMSQLDGYKVGGSVHIVLNNQIGFTANYKECRSSIYCTDIAKVTESPVFHVNADDPIAVIHAVEMAVQIRQLFNVDVFVDILGYRRYGHNEGDEPRFTQPMLYKSISKHEDVYKIFKNQLLNDGVITDAESKEMVTSFKKTLQEKLDHTRNKKNKAELDMFKRKWVGFRTSKPSDFEKSVKTGVAKASLAKVAKALTTVPKDFNIFKKTDKLLRTREDMFFNQNQVDWGLAEQLAFGTLIAEGHNVRLSGQDCQRGTFSHRHSVIKDEVNETHYTPLNSVSKKADLEVLNSHLSEYCVMGFEYGVSLASPNDLTIWEAQFGDFSNGAQIMIDQYLSSSERKWQRMSGLTLLLPHGYEGQGPEHSSARFERYLQLCAENNMYVVNITSPANFFHALRRQIHNEFRIPMVVMSPKSLLRHPKVVSDVADLEKGEFQEILDDNVKNPKRVICCTGKVYYDLIEKRDELAKKDVAIVRFEQLYPLPQKQIEKLKKKYAKAEWVWAQEEPENMGPWSHIMRHVPTIDWHYVGRNESASPAVGSSKVHAKQQDELINQAFSKLS
ncbi:MAG: 2-oxoglutarate dehydrogenase E1 component [Candidatus Margulisiibacteriota bacterium]|nr:2-oxoglutarate dehydrogenase E1 component [Candidatus Margulisiibacteriota bacterium]